MAQFHFVEDYERLVADLVARFPIDEAMSLAVGGDYERVGRVERAIVTQCGLADGMALIDLGCGSGRLAHALGGTPDIAYLGIDIVDALLDYARSKAPPHYRFVRHRDLSLPAADGSADMIVAFSVFTHLLQAETYLYLEDMRRVLKPGGRIVFSFLEFHAPQQWLIFDETVEAQRTSSAVHLNMFLERSAIDVWCDRLGLDREAFIDGDDTRWGGEALGQSVAVLRKPA
jgi:SAM-dependent methyltransferase